MCERSLMNASLDSKSHKSRSETLNHHLAPTLLLRAECCQAGMKQEGAAAAS